MKIVTVGLNSAISELDGLPQLVEQARVRANYRIAAHVHRDARKNAPISPSQAQINAQRKTKRRRKRKVSATSRAKPGSLQNSVEMAHSAESAEIYVPTNSPAGKYAYKMHEEKGQTWRRRGPGTVAKGAQADDKYIERAVKKADGDGSIRRIYESEVRKALRPGA